MSENLQNIKLVTTAIWQIFFCPPLWSESHLIGHSLTCSYETAKRRPEQTEYNNESQHNYWVFNLCHLEHIKAFSTRYYCRCVKRFNFYSGSLMDVKECQSSVLAVSLLCYFTVSELHRIYSNISRRWDSVVSDEAVGWTSEESRFYSRWRQEIFFIFKPSRPALGPISGWMQGAFIPQIKRPGCETDYLV
jgi:hypothetical protein